MYTLDKNIIYYIFIIILVISCFIKNKIINELAISMCIYFLYKWITNYRKCTLSYIECKIRNIPKEKGYIFNLLEPIFDLNKKKYAFFLYFIIFIIFCINTYNNSNFY